MSLTTRIENNDDAATINTINERAFGGPIEAKLVDSLRKKDCVIASLIAEADDEIVGHILFSRATLITQQGHVPTTALAPMAVLPEHQNRGIGTLLVRDGLEACNQLGEQSVFVLGHPAFYPRFGFSAQLAEPFKCEFGQGAAWMALELVPGVLSGLNGRIEYSKPFSEI